jgi:hypothetical protein
MPRNPPFHRLINQKMGSFLAVFFKKPKPARKKMGSFRYFYFWRPPRLL